jgi:hypothetical protein
MVRKRGNGNLYSLNSINLIIIVLLGYLCHFRVGHIQPYFFLKIRTSKCQGNICESSDSPGT